MKLQTYEDIKIEVISKTPNTKAMKAACELTQKKLETLKDVGSLSHQLASFLIKADHTSIFEHASITFLASGISRSLLAQVTRQRHFSFTSASQHYQDYRDYPMSIKPGYEKGHSLIRVTYRKALEDALRYYTTLIEMGEKPEEARQVLPNACTANLIITANPRALVEFLQTRLCKRNTLEMQIFAEKLLQVCFEWIPEIFDIGPSCYTTDKCNQGKMTCGCKI